MQIEEKVILAPHTTFHIGGPAKFFARVSSIKEIVEVFKFASVYAMPVFVLGGGSNVLFSDGGFDGLVCKIELQGITHEEEVNGWIQCTASAGELWDHVVGYAVERGWWGIENLSGIPGVVGGAVVQNIGAYGAALSQTLHCVEVFDLVEHQVKKLKPEECEFGYRESVFTKQKDRYIVLSATLRLSIHAAPNISYTDLAQRFSSGAPTLSAIRSAVLAIRSNKFPDLAVEGTAGSFFKNPIVPMAQAQKIKATYPELPLFLLPESADIKIPLGWFLDYRHGVMDVRNMRVGGVRMYEKQFLVIVAERGTQARDVERLALEIQKKVKDTIGIVIEPEVKIIF